jgi:CD80-like C2-set immunoglobulin domain
MKFLAKFYSSGIFAHWPVFLHNCVHIAVAPDTLTITGPDTAKINDTLSLECVTSNSNPASSIQWVVDGRIIPPTTNASDTSADGGWITKSTASIRIASSDRNKDVSCYANNFALSTTKVQTHRIKVLCKFLINSVGWGMLSP